ncbi:VOC family protein [Alkalihalobacillus sp. AL-G]|uniref:VOC family protein n=1 Tax=Alkalihalobacillus sp. AL-G TaxID=2926399 RepID=UPI00272CDD02|nr:VOC family protein [Alkalihalobacillus sp. AL-G]WLD94251.1 VOC family protein [Alkalihalobacillus sp. AL-G]
MDSQTTVKHQIESIPCIHLPVTNLERSVEFWTGNFDCTFGDEYQPETKMASVRIENGDWIFLYEVEKVPTAPSFKGGTLNNSDNDQVFAATLNVKNPQELFENLKEHGVRLGQLREAWTGHAFDCYDPDGHKFNIWGGEWIESE